MSVSAVLLAGGDSRRMGRDKAELLFRGTPLWQVQLAKLKRIKPVEIFLSLRQERSWQPAGATVIFDDQPSRGPLNGIIVALRKMEGSHLLVLPIDMPFVTINDLQRLIDECDAGKGVAWHSSGTVEPLAAIYPREAAAFAGSVDSPKALIRELQQKDCFRLLPIAGAQAARFRSVNTPADLAEHF